MRKRIEWTKTGARTRDNKHRHKKINRDFASEIDTVAKSCFFDYYLISLNVMQSNGHCILLGHNKNHLLRIMCLLSIVMCPPSKFFGSNTFHFYAYFHCVNLKLSARVLTELSSNQNRSKFNEHSWFSSIKIKMPPTEKVVEKLKFIHQHQ